MKDRLLPRGVPGPGLGTLRLCLMALLVVLLSSCSGDVEPPLTLEEAHQQFLERVTEMMRHCAIQVDSLVKYAAGVDTTYIPGQTWPFSFLPIAPEFHSQDSLRTRLVASSGGELFSYSASLETLRAATGLRPPTPEDPVDRLMCYLDHSLSSYVSDNRISKRARYSTQYIGLTRDSMNISCSFSSDDCRDRCDSGLCMSVCRDQGLYLSGWFAPGSSDLLAHPYGITHYVQGAITERTMDSRVRRTSDVTWDFHGDLLPGYRAIIKSTHDDFASFDTISFSPHITR